MHVVENVLEKVYQLGVAEDLVVEQASPRLAPSVPKSKTGRLPKHVASKRHFQRQIPNFPSFRLPKLPSFPHDVNERMINDAQERASGVREIAPSDTSSAGRQNVPEQPDC